MCKLFLLNSRNSQVNTLKQEKKKGDVNDGIEESERIARVGRMEEGWRKDGVKGLKKSISVKQ